MLSTTGIPLSRMTALKRSLSMQSADVGDARELQESLDGTVLAKRAVQDGKNDVDIAERCGLAVQGHRQVLGIPGPESSLLRSGCQLPATVAGALDRPDLVAVGIEALEHGARRHNGD